MSACSPDCTCVKDFAEKYQEKVCICPDCGQNCYTKEQLISHQRTKKYHEDRKKIDKSMQEFQITVWMDSDGKMWYTAWRRRVHFLWRGIWKEIKPTHQPTYDKAIILTASYLHH